MEIRQVDSEDLARLLARGRPRDRAHHQERFGMQERGEATYLVAWDRDVACGRVTVFRRSKYQEVREALGDFPELNALEATPQGRGIGSRLILAAEACAEAVGADRLGLAVEQGSVDARRLYERLGSVEWPHGDVVDRWAEVDDAGTVVRQHADRCAYLVKETPGGLAHTVSRATARPGAGADAPPSGRRGRRGGG